MVLSVLGIKLCTSYGMLIVTLGVLMGLGTGAIAFGLVLSSAISFVGQERSLFLAGLLNASAGMVNFFLAPLLNFSLQHGGVPSTMPRLALIMVLLIPCIRYLTKKDSTIKGRTDVPRLGLGEIQSALGNGRTSSSSPGFQRVGSTWSSLNLISFPNSSPMGFLRWKQAGPFHFMALRPLRAPCYLGMPVPV
ncbi:hypothetical protein M5E89_07275 [Acidaminococcus intestini]|nr:hypothetical protein M5E89_07275 [Acidaminococcus intestini]